MANFPSLNPSSRTYTPGSYSIKQFTTASGASRRVLLGTAPVSASLELVFEYFSESDVKLILDHYDTQKGSFTGFALSSNLSADLASTTLTPAGNSWIYAEPPSVEYVAAGVYTASVSLVSVI